MPPRLPFAVLVWMVGLLVGLVVGLLVCAGWVDSYHRASVWGHCAKVPEVLPFFFLVVRGVPRCWRFVRF